MRSTIFKQTDSPTVQMSNYYYYYYSSNSTDCCDKYQNLL